MQPQKVTLTFSCGECAGSLYSISGLSPAEAAYHQFIVMFCPTCQGVKITERIITNELNERQEKAA